MEEKAFLDRVFPKSREGRNITDEEWKEVWEKAKNLHITGHLQEAIGQTMSALIQATAGINLLIAIDIGDEKTVKEIRELELFLSALRQMETGVNKFGEDVTYGLY